MSYILDALRKSDAQRRLGQSPDLSNAAAPASPGRSHRPGRVLAIVLISLLVIAVPAALWFGGPLQGWVAGLDRGSESVPAPSDPEMVVALVDERESPESGAEQDRVAAASEERDEPAVEQPAAVDRRSPARPPVNVASRPAPQRAVDVPRPAPQREFDVPAAPVERERMVETAEEAQRLIEEAQRETERRRSPAPSAAAEPAASVQTEPETWAPERSDYVRRWELPLAIRRDLPELSLSIHVFSAQPQSRFVLINGERRLEGDDLGQGARLLEIRREGALVEFRDYRFLLEP